MSGLIPVTTACILAASQLQNIHPMNIMTILRVEGGKVGEYSENTNGTRDLGPMQINDRVWLPEIAEMHFNGNENAARYAVQNDGCYNVHIGAWILRKNINSADGDIIEGIGRYHSRTPKYKKRYIAAFKKNFNELFGKHIFK
jgi:hypothetical protein